MKREKRRRIKVENRSEAAVLPERVDAPLGVRDLAITAILLASIFIAFSEVRNHHFITFDDYDYVKDNPVVIRGLTREGVHWAFTTFAQANWHPLTWLSHMLDVELFGVVAGKHLLVNLFFHAVAAAFLYLTLRKATGRVWPSALATALFALHPLRVESIAWVSERKDTLSTCFWILTCFAYVFHSRRKTIFRYSVVLTFFALGLLAKPMLVTLPFALLLLDFWPLSRFSFNVASLRAKAVPLVVEKIPMFILAIASSVVTFVAQQSGGAISTIEGVSIVARSENTIVAYARYLGKIVWPARLSILYPFAFDYDAISVAGAFLLIAAITALAVRNRHSRPYLLVGWLWFLGTLVPVIGLVQVGTQAIADRYTYIPSVGIFLAVAWLVADLPGTAAMRRVAAGASVAIVIALGVTTLRQVSRWRDSVTLFQHVIDVTERNSMGHYLLAFAYTQRGENDAAIAHYNQSIALVEGSVETRRDPSAATTRKYFSWLPEAYNSLGRAYLAEKDLDGASKAAASAVRLNPRNPRAHDLAGSVLYELGHYADAARAHRRSMELNPSAVSYRISFGRDLLASGDPEGAARSFEDALRIAPNSADAYNNLGSAYTSTGDDAKAARSYERAIRLRPDFFEAHLNYGSVLSRSGKAEDAVAHFQSAVVAKPDSIEALVYLALGKIKLRRSEEAAALLERSMRLDAAETARFVSRATRSEFDEARVGAYVEFLKSQK